MKLRIFISSVQREFAEERRLLADYIRKDALLGVFFDVFLFEEVEACDKTPQGVYLGEVEASDIYIGLLGQKFGYETETGVSATECEYDLATKLGKTRLVFIKDVVRREPKEARNLTIAQALNWAGYVEKSGNGTESIVRRCLDAGLPKPEYHPDNVDFKAVIWRNPARLGAVGAQLGRSQGAVGAQSRRSQGAVGAKSPREKCLVLLVESELKRKEIADGVGMPSRSGYLSRLLAELVGDGLIERTIPDKPNSSQQRYRLTEKGRTVVGSCIPHNDLS